MIEQPDWRDEIQQHAAARGVHLPATTVEELAEHLDDVHAAAMRDGCSPGEAYARARAALEESTIELLRGRAVRTPASGHAPMPAGATTGKSLNIGGAVRLAVRQLRLRPAFAAVTILVLALGIGASTTVFSIVDSVLLSPLPYRQPDRLVTLWDSHSARGLAHERISPVTFMDYRELRAFEGAAAWWRPSLNLVDPGLEPLRVNAIETSGNLFDVLGVRPQLGPGFPAGGPLFVATDRAVVISDRLWRTRYGGDPGVVGRQLRLNDRPHTVAGIMPPRLHFPDDVDVWQLADWDFRQHSRGAHFMEAVVRLADGVSLEQATVHATQLSERLGTEFPGTNRGWTPRLVPLLEEALGYYRPALIILVGAAGLVLIVGCLNVASLLLTRALSREREVAVRIAIGASPRQLIVQLLAESFVLSMAGATLGIAAATITLPALAGMAPAGIPRLEDAGINPRALALAAALVVTTTMVFGLVPAVVILRRRSGELRASERGSSRGTRRAYSVLVAGQMALACTLLVASALLIRTVARMVDTPTGVDADEVVTASIQLPIRAANSPNNFPQWLELARSHTALLERIREQPGVRSAGATNFLPLEAGWRVPVIIDGEPPARADDRPRPQFHTVTDGYFEAMGVTLARGRFLSALDTEASPGAIVVNERFVARYLRGERSPLGRTMTTDAFNMGPLGRNLLIPVPAPQGQPPATASFEIVGIVRDVRNVPLGQEVDPAIYFSAQQFPFRETTFTVRAISPASAVAAIRTALAATLPDVPIGVAQTWNDRLAAHTAEPRLLMVVLMFFGATAGLLAALGVYGLFSWSVAQRTRELAIRLTLGARPVSVGAAVIRHSVVLIAVGLVAGLLIVRLAEETLTRVLFELSPRDPLALIAASTLLGIVALAACVPPALRALRVDPVEGLRTE